MKTSHANPIIATYTDVVVVDRELVVICVTYGWVVGCATKWRGRSPSVSTAFDTVLIPTLNEFL